MGPRRKINFKELPKQLTRTVGSGSAAAKPVRYCMYIHFARPADLGPYPSIPAGLASRWQALAPTSTYLAKLSIPESCVAHSFRVDRFTLSILSLPKDRPPRSDIDEANRPSAVC